MFLDIGITTDLSLVPNRVTELAEAGFDGVFTAESNRDVFAPLILAAEHSLSLIPSSEPTRPY